MIPPGTDIPDQTPAVRWAPVALGGVAVAVVVGIVLRFIADTPMWLDEALSVNIASLGPDGWVDGLRQDGHPPLYYALLWGWMELFGTTDGAARAFSGVVSVATLPLAYIAGRRMENRSTGLAALVLFAASPFAIRYGTETRMYALVSLLALALWLLVDPTIGPPSRRRQAGIAAVTAALCYTHYWTLWFLAAIGLMFLARLLRGSEGESADARPTIAALVVGGLAFIPWLPVLLDQAAHTGTPWGARNRPAGIISTTVFELGGGPRSEAQLVSIAIVVFVLLGLFGVATQASLTLQNRLAPAIRPIAWIAAATLTIGATMGWLSASTYQPRYAAVIVPFVLLLAARGVTRLPTTALAIVGTGVVVVSLATATYVSNIDRSQADQIAAYLDTQAEPGDVVVYCPDQLGPATSRYLPDGLTQLTYPALTAPDRVDWRDYADRNDAADPAEIGAEILARADGRSLFVVLSTGYRTYEGDCERLIETLTASRPGATVIGANNERYESSALVVFTP